MIRNKIDFTNKIQKEFKYLALDYHNQQLVGSSSIKKIMHYSDYDLYEKTIINNKLTIYNLFLNKYVKLKSNEYILDFKCGIDINGEPIRWDYTKLLKKKKLFFECLDQISVIKMDLASKIDGIYNEFSEIYYLTINGNTTYNKNDLTKVGILKAIKNEFYDLLDEGKNYKALKRYFSYIIIDKNDFDEKLINIFNGQLGLIYLNASNLNLLGNLLEKVSTIKNIDIINNLQIIKQLLSFITKYDIHSTNKIDAICKIKNRKTLIHEIYKYNEYLMNIVNRDPTVLNYLNKIKNL